MSKERITMVEYMQNIKGIIDDLALIGLPLHGFGNDYKELQAAIRTRETTMTFEELHDKLLDHEIFLKREEVKKLEQPITAPITAQFNQCTNNYKASGGNTQTNNRRRNNNYGNKSS
ncbi:hypothetical protein Dsin_011504 [Dipteronia sinensis]|uniref:Uncharacterized protein n=1 Tax=Dipteronia sinensis TaxID=43782 RepID=A0AAE0AVS8_9ROSI|nr:hypothetical protein Dsin_011504 [Dipteronia sinensis]